MILAALASMAGVQTHAQQMPADSRGAAEPARQEEPKAELRLYGSREVKSSWAGSGPNILLSDLCVSSSTGRFRLRILSSGGGRMASPASLDRIGYTLRFRDGSGQVQSREVSGQALITLEGRSPEDVDCSHGANSQIEIDLAEPDMLARAAGRYFDQLVLSVDPL
ncbi:hypothetical protein [Sphingobium sp.]|uniref:hypothetical protein n=1 Tax=Sphingobium sp. TaxID=1912891 RepID=UPI002BA25B26|nr:hypothetical protein [Sphingobium sp.]HUD92110.1 hypothetical protein [Sphingobium sp.]